MESLRLKRMISKYSYCIDEFNETEFLFKEYSSNFNKEFNIPVPEQVITEQSEEMETKVENELRTFPVSDKSSFVARRNA